MSWAGRWQLSRWGRKRVSDIILTDGCISSNRTRVNTFILTPQFIHNTYGYHRLIRLREMQKTGLNGMVCESLYWLGTQYGTARVGGRGIIRTHQVEGRGQTGRIPFVFWNVYFNCTAAAEKAPWLESYKNFGNNSRFRWCYMVFAAFDGIQLEPPRGVEEAAKAGFEVFRLLLIVDEANTHRPQILANFMRAFFQRLRRNEPNEPNESAAEDFSVLSDDERLGKCDNGYSSVAQSYWQRCEHGNGQCAWQCDLVNIHGEYKSSTAYTRNIARYNSWYERDFSCIEF